MSTKHYQTFEFVATVYNGAEKYEITINIADDGRPMVDLADDAEEKAHKRAARHFGTEDLEVVSV